MKLCSFMKPCSLMALSCLVFAAAGCGAPSAAPSLATDRVMGSCDASAAADSYDAAAGRGCQARTMLQVCEVPSGSVIHADGTITTPAGTSVACSPTCAADEFTMGCHGSMEAGIPAPAGHLGCRAIPLPTPPLVLNYCCPCQP